MECGGEHRLIWTFSIRFTGVYLPRTSQYSATIWPPGVICLKTCYLLRIPPSSALMGKRGGAPFSCTLLWFYAGGADAAEVQKVSRLIVFEDHLAVRRDLGLLPNDPAPNILDCGWQFGPGDQTSRPQRSPDWPPYSCLARSALNSRDRALENYKSRSLLAIS